MLRQIVKITSQRTVMSTEPRVCRGGEWRHLPSIETRELFQDDYLNRFHKNKNLAGARLPGFYFYPYVTAPLSDRVKRSALCRQIIERSLWTPVIMLVKHREIRTSMLATGKIIVMRDCKSRTAGHKPD